MAIQKSNSLSLSDVDEINYLRQLGIYKSSELVQRGKHDLCAVEQKLVHFAISLIKPDDNEFTEYEFYLKDFMAVCGMRGSKNHSALREKCKRLYERTLWIVLDEGDVKREIPLRWFNTFEIIDRNGCLKVKFKFHETIMPHLFNLRNRYEETGEFYCFYNNLYLLPMKSTFSMRLYELLKSYLGNKEYMEWSFGLDDLRDKLNCQTYANIAMFKNRVLDVAVKEINEYSDIYVTYKPNKPYGATHFIFEFIPKKEEDRRAAQKRIATSLDGKIHYWD